MLSLARAGLFCPAGDFHIDPSRGVDHAVVTHAHSDHARRGSREYYCAKPGLELLRARLGYDISVQGYAYGEKFRLGNVTLSFHPAGHILGSAQVRMEYAGQVWVASGDYKRESDPTCEPFESVPCDVFVTEATFGTPAYVWEKGKNLGQEIHDWWQRNAARGEHSVLFAYSLGKAQRVLGVLNRLAPKPIICDPLVTELNECYRQEGVPLAQTICLSEIAGHRFDGELLLVPQGFLKSPLAGKLGGRFQTAFASGWMNGGRSRFHSGYDHGFTMSDHADWNDLVRTILESGARKVYVQHRNGALVRHLRTLGLQAYPEEDLRAGESRQLQLF
ncbi:MAG TPA: ligase-associated DNA damage response exonuclease [Bdellovibrionales bacterium]|nr:ligase-associated DNA damage response exonuclease [Bdellovibrionales bacterium]